MRTGLWLWVIALTPSVVLGFLLGRRMVRCAWRRRLRKPVHRVPRIMVELKGGGFLDGRRLVMDDPGPVIFVPVIPRTASEAPERIEQVRFRKVGTRQEKLMDPGEVAMFELVAKSIKIPDHVAAEVLGTEFTVHIYQHEDEPLPSHTTRR